MSRLATVPLIVRLDVPAAQIAAGIPRNCARCPVALALRAAPELAGFLDVGVTYDGVEITDAEGIHWAAPLPPAVEFFMADYDLGLHGPSGLRGPSAVEPFSAVLTFLPEPSPGGPGLS